MNALSGNPFFKDEKFEQFIRFNLKNHNPEGAITSQEMAEITHLNYQSAAELRLITEIFGTEVCSASGVPFSAMPEHIEFSDITGIEFCVNLEHLSLGDHAGTTISDISLLSTLTKLKTVDLSYGRITEFTPLINLLNLEWLFISGNPIRSIQPLSGLTNLSSLHLAKCHLSDISPLAGLTNLSYLNISDNQISDISVLSGLTNLSHLHINDNNISDISPLAGLNLQSIQLGGNPITDLSPILTNVLYQSDNLIIRDTGGISLETLPDGNIQLFDEDGNSLGIYGICRCAALSAKEYGVH